MPDDTRKRLIELSSGDYCESDVLGIVERIKAYDPNLQIQYLAGRPGLSDAPYRLVERCPDGLDRVVFDIWDLDARVLERIEAADIRRHDILARLDEHNRQVKEKEKRHFREEVLGEARDKTEAVLRSPKGSYTLPFGDGKQVKLDSHTPVKIIDPKTGREFKSA